MLEHRAFYPSAQAAASTARRAVIAFARVAGFTGDQLQDLELAVGEAFANAVEHGHRDNGLIAVEAKFDDGVIEIDISDAGGGFAGWETSQPAREKTESVRGFGIGIMHATTDRMQYFDGGRRIRLIKRRAVAHRNGSKQEER